jgi:hypothetical protein
MIDAVLVFASAKIKNPGSQYEKWGFWESPHGYLFVGVSAFKFWIKLLPHSFLLRQ